MKNFENLNGDFNQIDADVLETQEIEYTDDFLIDQNIVENDE